MTVSDRQLIIGVGNRARRDDGAGPAVLDALPDRQGIETVEVAGDCVRLIDLWDGRHDVVVVDAAHSGAVPGTVLRFDAVATHIPRDTFIHTSHAFGVAEAVAMARLLGRLPENLIIWGVEGKDFRFGTDLTPAVRKGAAEVAARIAGRWPDRAFPSTPSLI